MKATLACLMAEPVTEEAPVSKRRRLSLSLKKKTSPDALVQTEKKIDGRF